MDARKQKAMSALNLEHWEEPVMPFQFQTLPQFIGPMKLVRRPKATMNKMKRMKSAGQWRKLPAKGRRKSNEKKMPSAATTSV